MFNNLDLYGYGFEKLYYNGNKNVFKSGENSQSYNYLMRLARGYMSSKVL